MKEEKITIIGLTGESIFMKCDHFHEVGETIIVDKYHKEYGGKGYNQAVAAARFGAKVDFITLVGDDDIATSALDLMRKENNITPHFITRANARSAAANILVDKTGENRVSCYLGVARNMTKEDVKSFRDVIANSTYLLLQLETSDEATLEAIDIAYQNGTKIILNPAPAKMLSKSLLDKCYLLTPNMQEASIIFNLGKNYTKDDLLKLDIERLIITLGDKGCLVKDGNNIYQINAEKVKALNTTGAGDTFNGILTAALLEGKTLYDAATLAVKGATISVTREFVIDSIPKRDEIL